MQDSDRRKSISIPSGAASRLRALFVGGRLLAVTGLLSALSMAYAPQSKAAIAYDLDIYAIDDSMSISITNANYSNYLIGTYNFGATPTVDLSPFITPGANDIGLQVANIIAGYSYSFGLLENGSTVVSGACGIWNGADEGCNGDSYQDGLVWTADIVLNGDDGIITSFDSGLVSPALPSIAPISSLQTPSVSLAYTPTGQGTSSVPLPASIYFLAAGLIGIAGANKIKPQWRSRS